jgi:hypothetical protein
MASPSCEPIFERSTLWFYLLIGNALKHCTFQLCHYILTLRGLYIPRWTEPRFGDHA